MLYFPLYGHSMASLAPIACCEGVKLYVNLFFHSTVHVPDVAMDMSLIMETANAHRTLTLNVPVVSLQLL